MLAVAKVFADPVAAVSHQMRANCTSALPILQKA